MVTGMKDVVTDVIDGCYVLKIDVGRIAGEGTFPHAKVSPEDKAGFVQFTRGACCRTFLRTEHPELNPIRLPVRFIEAVLLVRRDGKLLPSVSDSDVVVVLADDASVVDALFVKTSRKTDIEIHFSLGQNGQKSGLVIDAAGLVEISRC